MSSISFLLFSKTMFSVLSFPNISFMYSFGLHASVSSLPLITGISKKKEAPFSLLGYAPITPPCCSTMVLAYESPIPLPPISLFP